MNFTVPLEDVTVEQEEKVTLQCELSKLNQKVTWLKNGKALTFKEKNRYKITADGAKHTLVIPKADLEDNAEFTCSLNDVKTQGKITVKGSNIINISSGNLLHSFQVFRRSGCIILRSNLPDSAKIRDALILLKFYWSFV